MKKTRLSKPLAILLALIMIISLLPISALAATLTGVTISGTVKVGETLTAAVTPEDATASYQWKVADAIDGEYTDIIGATSNTYSLTVNEQGKYIKVVATGSGDNSGEVTSEATSAVAEADAVTTALTGVTISGTVKVGETLTAAVTPEDAAASYQWKVADAIDGEYTDITDATSSTYEPTENEQGKYIKVAATGIGDYSGEVTSEATSAVAEADPVTTALTGVTISGTVKVGETLTAAVTPAGAEATYQWKVADTGDGEYIDITGATNSTYEPTDNEQGKYIMVVATGSGDNSGEVTSEATSAVAEADAVTTALTGVTISGTVKVGETLTAAVTPDGAEATYQWKVADTSDGEYADIIGATSNAYALTVNEQGKYIMVVATGSGDNSGEVTSEATSAVAEADAVTTALTGVTIRGTVKVGETLTAAVTPAGAEATYQWKVADTGDGEYIDITGATNSTYEPTDNEQGKYIKVVATGSGEYSGKVTSAATIAVAEAEAQTDHLFTVDENGKLTSVTDADGSSASGEVVIPSVVDGIEVQTLSNGLFSQNANVTSVTIPNTVTTIEDGKSGMGGTTGTFYGTAGLTEVVFESGSQLTTIGVYAFVGTGLKILNLPDSVTTIKENTFRETEIESIGWPSGLKTIEKYAFFRSSLSGALVLPEGLETMGGYVFKQCPNITSVTLPGTLKEGDRQWFVGCTGIESVQVLGGVDFTLPNSTFSSCTSLERVIIGEGVKVIDKSSFEKCNSLIAVTLPESLTTINSDAFTSCELLSVIELPASVTEVQSDAFDGCTALQKVIKRNSGTVLTGEVFTDVPAVTLYINDDDTDAVAYAAGYDNVSTASISTYTNTAPAVTSSERSGTATPAAQSGRPVALFYRADISGWFADAEGNTLIYEIMSANDSGNVDVNGDITIEGTTFTYFPKAAQANKTVTVVLRANDATEYSEAVTLTIEVKAIPSNSTDDFTIDAEGRLLSYYGVGGEVTIPDTVNGITVRTLSSGLFSENTAITSVFLPDTVTGIEDSDNTNPGAFYGCTALASVTLPDGLVRIGSYSFDGCTALEEIVFPDSLKEIGASAFAGSALRSVTWPSGVTILDDRVLEKCTNLTSVTLHEGITKFNGNCFNGCSALATINLPDSITFMGTYVFRDCTNLESIVIPKGVTNIGSSTFYGCSMLASVTLHDDVEGIGRNAFVNCVNLQSITLNDTLTQIGRAAFSGCSVLRSITIPESVSSEINAFRNCAALERIIIKNPTATINQREFNGVPNLTIYAPAGSPAETFAENKGINFVPISLSVKVTVQDIAGLVSSDGSVLVDTGKAEAYSLSYPDGIEFGDITVLDALIAAHEEQYSDAFTMGTQLAVDDSGNVTRAFGEDVTSFGFSVNGVKGTGDLAEVTISPDDVIHFFYGDGLEFARFYQNEEPASSVLMLLNREYAFKVQSESGEPLRGLKVYSIDAGASSLSDVFPQTPIGVTDAGGAITISFSTVGRYVLAAKADDNSVVYGLLIVDVYPADNRIGSITVAGEPEFDTSAPLKSGYYAGTFVKTGASTDAGFHQDYYAYDCYVNPLTTEVTFNPGVFDEAFSAILKLTVKVNSSTLPDYTNLSADTTSNQWTDIPISITSDSTSVEFIVSYTEESITYTKKYQINVIKSPLDSTGILQGGGTEDDPYLINSLNDLLTMRDLVNRGNAFAGEYFKLMTNLTLPENWVPIGNTWNGVIDLNSNTMGKYMQPFSGVFNGGGHTVTVPEGGLALMGFVREAVVKNLNIYGKRIAGYGLVNYYCIDYGPDGTYGGGDEPSFIIEIDNVTLKSGSSTLNSGFIGGVGSGINKVTIRNSTVEHGVTIGYGKNQVCMGSFAGSLNGTIENCVSYANVYGTKYVGGIAGSKGQSMGPCAISNCVFSGNVTASEDKAGGIMGCGYDGSGTAPNSPCVSIKNCFATGSVTGTDMVGGILGAESGVVQCWDNGVGYIQNNHFSGTVTATSGANIGGIIGYMQGLDRYNVISNNYYIDTCGATTGIGYVKYIDTSCENPTASNLVERYFDTSSGNPTIVGASKLDHNRTDDPMGADADNLSKAVTAEQLQDGTVTSLLNEGESSSKNWTQGTLYPVFNGEPIVVGLELSGNYKTVYYIGDSFSKENMVFTAKYSNGDIKKLTSDEVVFEEGFDSSKRATLRLTVKYGAAVAEYTVRVLNPESTDITVSFVLLGDYIHDSETDGVVHTLRAGNLETWIEKDYYVVSNNATVMDVFAKVLLSKGYSWYNQDEKTLNDTTGNYISAIVTPEPESFTLSHFTNGPDSGWMYTLNGTHPLLGVNEQYLNNGDIIVFHYTDNYHLEEGSENWGTPGDANGGSGAAEVSTKLTPETTVTNGAASASVDKADVDKILKEAEENGTTNIKIDAKTTQSVTKSSVTIPAGSTSDMAKAGMSLTVETSTGTFDIDNSTLKSIAAKGGGSVELSAERLGTDNLTDANKELVGDHPVFDLSITVGSSKITDFGDGAVTVSLPYTPADGEDTDNLTVYYIDADGNAVEMEGAHYDEKTGSIIFKTDHFSTFAVVYEAALWTNPFTDVTTDDWFYQAVEFAASNGLFGGMTDTTFGPNAAMTRAMLVTVLYRLEEEPDVTADNLFTDVADDEWYTDAVIWASENKIVGGYGGGLFGTNDSITREQMATILYNYASYKGYDVTASADISAYTDADDISTWAESAMQWANAEGLINGVTETTLNPSGSATRAQVATILMRLVENIVQ